MAKDLNAYNFAKYLKSTNGRCISGDTLKKFGFECTKDSCPFWMIPAPRYLTKDS